MASTVELRGVTSIDPRMVQQLGGQRLDLVGERRREKQVLPFFRQQREHALHVRDETHVEHPVGLVEHEELDRGEIDVTLPVMIEQAAGRGHQDVDAALELHGLRPDAHAAEDHHRREFQVLAVHADGFFDLRGEFAGGREDQRAQRLALGARVRGRLVGQALQHRQYETGGLAGAGLRAGEEVATGENGWNGLGLDRRRRGVAMIGDRAQQRFGEPE